MNENMTYSGCVVIVGRPNVGKSTLLNQLLGQKVSITSHKPQTTIHYIMGIHTEGPYQAIYLDTPGMQVKKKRALNCLINFNASRSIGNIELIIFVVEGTYWVADDEMVVNNLRNLKLPVVLTINKIDNIANKAKLLPHIHFLSQKMNFYDIIPISAENGINVDTLSRVVHDSLPEAVHYFPEDYITDHSQRFMASEIIREKLIRFLGKELPYVIRVETEFFITNKCGSYNIQSLIFVERESQKRIVIGNKGNKIKTIGIEARQDMEIMFQMHVHLKLWVKVKSSWDKDNF